MTSPAATWRAVVPRLVPAVAAGAGSGNSMSITGTASVQTYLDELACAVVCQSAQERLELARQCRPVLVDLVARAVHTRMAGTPVTDVPVPFNLFTWSELCCIALASLLPVYPHLANSCRAFFQTTPAFFERLATSADTTVRQAWPVVAKAAFRLLSNDPTLFRTRWDWTSLYRLLDANDDEWMTRLWVIRSITLLQGYSSPELLFHLLPENARVQATVVCNSDDNLLNELRLQLQHGSLADDEDSTSTAAILPQDDSSIVVTAADLSSDTVELCGILLPRGRASSTQRDHPASPIHHFEPLVLTETTKANLHTLALSLALGAPILLEGATGAGKTAIVEEAARILGRPDLIKIHLGDQTDGKALLGNYVCSQTPGDFRWQPGLLTRAVLEGRWILIEDIDYAPTDVLSVLLPLLETRQLFVSARGEQLHAQPGFQIFATRTVSTSSRTSVTASASTIGDHLWTRIKINPLQPAELLQIIRTSYTSIAAHSETAMSLFTKALTQRSTLSRPLSSRDLLKWCRRVSAIVPTQLHDHHMPQPVREIFLIEAFDCYVAMLPNTSARQVLLQQFADELGLSREYVHHISFQYKPAVQRTPSAVSVGRATLPLAANNGASDATAATFAYTGHTMRHLERLAVAVQHTEAVLLVGETGAGKTTLVQHLASRTGQQLLVINLSQQSESTDLLGGFKPVDVLQLATPLMEQFESIFARTFSRKANQRFLTSIQTAFTKRRWVRWVTLLNNAVEQALAKLQEPSASTATTSSQQPEEPASSTSHRVQRLRLEEPMLLDRWSDFSARISRFGAQREQITNNFLFAFAEGLLVKAVQRGHWVLLDEVNLASTELLEGLSGLLESAHGSLVLPERASDEPGGTNDMTVLRHPSFRVFACMNPATDVGKRDLPPALRSRMTELYVDEMDSADDLAELVRSYLSRVTSGATPWADVVAFYMQARALAADGTLVDGAGVRPHFSLRTLARALEYTAIVTPTYGWRRSLYEGLSMSFLTQLNTPSTVTLRTRLEALVFKGDNIRSLTNNVPPQPPTDDVAPAGYELVEQFWICRAPYQLSTNSSIPKYSLTKSVKANLRSLARVVAARRFPVLIQGPTSAGKTSMIEHLANKTGHRFVRINNHEHTDLQEYLGMYITDPSGRLVFQEGVLVEALRKGYWIVLDELNLAPSEVLEALNRLLDDNRELFIPETQQTVHPHPSFMLFATQNPPGVYGGRKTLSRAFRNRFLELHFDEIPQNELATILQERCALAKSYAERFVAIYSELQSRRQGSRVFAGKHGFITLRDLFRWAGRNPVTAAWSYQEIAYDGFMILGERVRSPEEKHVVKEVLEKHFKVKIDIDTMYTLERLHASAIGPRLRAADERGDLRDVVWTPALCRLFTLVSRCAEHKEPVLLVGETGSGKTTVCQILAKVLDQSLTIVNCHEHSETADFLGSQRPMRRRGQIMVELNHACRALVALARDAVLIGLPSAAELDVLAAQVDDDHTDDARKISAVTDLADQCLKLWEVIVSETAITACGQITALRGQIKHLSVMTKTLFEWQDGPLVESMRSGHLFLLDEVSLADDSVLERLNSVLEPARLLVLAEKGGDTVEELHAHDNFLALATMNPGGDYGKKELSPALRNRFTEIWVPTISDRDNLLALVRGQLPKQVQPIAPHLLDFLDWYKATATSTVAVSITKRVISLRDVLSWVRFIAATFSTLGLSESYVQGASLVLLDALDTRDGDEFAARCIDHLQRQLSNDPIMCPLLASPHTLTWHVFFDESRFGIGPFTVSRGPCGTTAALTYTFDAPTTKHNALRVLRAMQLSKPILLEGPPGVGKTTLVQQLANLGGHDLVRINLSEQTDLSDLFGADLPVEGGQGGEFAWRDGPLLMALKAGHWILLDELNLASQAVLEGLNACLDHRASVYIPELDLTFQVTAQSRIFACQNPAKQGGGRKGLPKSFLNRFSHVYVRALTHTDLHAIVLAAYPEIDRSLLERLLTFNDNVTTITAPGGSVGRRGAPWEFNLRDVFRWVQLACHDPINKVSPVQVDDFTRTIPLIYLMRLRTAEDREIVWHLYQRIVLQGDINAPLPAPPPPRLTVFPSVIMIGDTCISRNNITRALPVTASSQPGSSLQLLESQAHALEALLCAVQHNWMALITGPSGTGKTTLVRLLAQVLHQPLTEFAINSSVDTTELLGSFEQVDLARTQQVLLTDTSNLIHTVLAMLLTHPMSESGRALMIIHRAWNSVTHSIANTSSDSAFALAHQLDQLLALLVTIDQHVVAFIEATNAVMASHLCGQVADLRSRTHRLRKLIEQPTSGRFEWVDGTLLRALETGGWVLMDNVNFCSPSVLDRLNPLFEPNGTLAVSERGLVDGEVRLVRPHPNFRLFLAMDPQHGEISRAMRNRALEISLLPMSSSVSATMTTTTAPTGSIALQPCPGEPSIIQSAWLQASELGLLTIGRPLAVADSERLLGAAGVLSPRLLQCLSRFHSSLTAALRESMTCVPEWDVRDALLAARVICEQLARGVSLASAVQVAVCMVYGPKVCPPWDHVQLRSHWNNFVHGLTAEVETINPSPYMMLGNLTQRLGHPNASVVAHGLVMLNKILQWPQHDPLLVQAASDQASDVVASPTHFALLDALTARSPVHNDLMSLAYTKSDPSADSWIVRYHMWLASRVNERWAGTSLAVSMGNLDQMLSLNCDRWSSYVRLRMIHGENDAVASVNRLMRLRARVRIQQLACASTTNGVTTSRNLYSISVSTALRSHDPTAQLHPMVGLLAPFVDTMGTSLVHALEFLIDLVFRHNDASPVVSVTHPLHTLTEQLELFCRYCLTTDVLDLDQLASHVAELLSAFAQVSPSLPVDNDTFHTIIKQVHTALRLDALQTWGALYRRGVHPLPQRSQVSATHLPADLSMNPLIRLRVVATLSQCHELVGRVAGCIATQAGLSPRDLAQAKKLLDICERALSQEIPSVEVSSATTTLAPLSHAIQRIVVAGGDYDALCNVWHDLTSAWQASLWHMAHPQEITIVNSTDDVDDQHRTYIPTQDPVSITLLARFTPTVLCIHKPFDFISLGLAPATTMQLSQVRTWFLADDGAPALLRPDDFTLSLSSSRILSLHPLDEASWWAEVLATTCAVILAHDPPTALVVQTRALVKDATRLHTSSSTTIMVTELLEALPHAIFSIPPSTAMLREMVCILDLVRQYSSAETQKAVATPMVRSHYLGQAWVACGRLLLYSSLLPAPVDPTTRARVQLSQHQHLAVNTSAQLVVELAQLALERTMTSQDLETLAHQEPAIRHLVSRQIACKQREQQLMKDVITRPTPSKLGLLYQEMQQIAPIIERITNLTTELDGPGNVSAAQAQAQEHSLQLLLQTMATRLDNQFQGYNDLTGPVIVGLRTLKTGLRFLSVSKHATERSIDPMWQVVHRAIELFVKFPYMEHTVQDDQHSLAYLVSQDALNSIRGLLRVSMDHTTVVGTKEQQPWAPTASTFVEYLEALLIRAHASFVNDPSTEHLSILRDLFNVFADLWQHAEDARTEKERRENEMYRHRVRATDIPTDDELDVSAFVAAFPDHAADFADLDPVDPLADEFNNNPGRRSSKPAAAPNAPAGPGIIFTSQDDALSLAFASAHQQLVCDIHACVFLNPYEPSTVDKSRLLRVCFRTAAHLIHLASPYVPRTVDVLAHAASLAMTSDTIAQIETSDTPHMLTNTIHEHWAVNKALRRKNDAEPVDDMPHDAHSDSLTNLPTLIFTNAKYSFYHDSNVAEARLIVPILEQLSDRLGEQLKDWPEHEVLQALLIIVQRILGFALSSPLAKLVTGLELLLKRAQDWEEYASKAMSFQTHLDSCAHLIIRWRKLEVQAWPTLLATRASRYAAQSARSWFLLHKLLNAHPSTGTAIDEPAGRQRLIDITQALNDFMQNATLGSFFARLQMVRAFAADFKQRPAQQDLYRILHHLSAYFTQFVPAVNQELDRLRSPLEKELKDVVKLARWNDLNYFALKQSADKSHRTLGRFLRKYDEILDTPLRNVLASIRKTSEPLLSATNVSPTTTTDSSTENGRSQQRLKDLLSTVAQTVDVGLRRVVESPWIADEGDGAAAPPVSSAANPPTRDPLLHERLPALVRRLGSHTYTSGRASRVIPEPALLAVNQAASLIIDQVQHFRARDAAALPFTEEKKPIFQALKQQKHRAFTNLLKHLGSLGLSYHRSVLAPGHFESLHIFSQPVPLVDHLLELVPSSMPIWNEIRTYTLRTLARLASLREATQGAVPDLSRRELERGAGFAEHLMHIVLQQQSLIADITCGLDTFLILRQTVESAATSTSLNGARLVPAIIVQPIIRLQAQILARIVLILEQCCDASFPLPSTINADIVSSLRADKLASISAAASLQDLEKAPICSGSILSSCLDRHQRLRDFASQLASEQAHPWEDMSGVLKITRGVLHTLHDLLLREYIHVSEPIIGQIAERMSQPIMAAPSVDLPKLNRAVERTLLAIQTLIGQHEQQLLAPTSSEVATANERNERDDDDDEYDYVCHPNLLGELHRAFVGVLSTLSVGSICASFWDALNELAQEPHARQAPLIDGASRVLAAFDLTLQRHLSGFLVFHRSCAKLAFVVTHLMELLALNGFCAPEGVEYTDADGEGELSMEDAQGTGMGEGEGRKDVSKEIDNEEQVLGTRDEVLENHGEHLEREEEDGLEMTNEFDGQLYDRPPPKPDGEQQDDADDADEDDMAEEMGETSRSAELLDRHLWDEPEDEAESDGDDNDDGKDKKKQETKDTDQQAPQADRPPQSETQIKAKDPSSADQQKPPSKRRPKPERESEVSPASDEDKAGEQDEDDEMSPDHPSPPLPSSNQQEPGPEDTQKDQKDQKESEDGERGDKDQDTNDTSAANKDEPQKPSVDDASSGDEEGEDNDDQGDRDGPDGPDEFPEMDMDDQFGEETGQEDDNDAHAGGDDGNEGDDDQFPDNMQLDDAKDGPGSQAAPDGIDGDDDGTENMDNSGEPADMDLPDDKPADGGPQPEQGESSKELAHGGEDAVITQGDQASMDVTAMELPRSTTSTRASKGPDESTTQDTAGSERKRQKVAPRHTLPSSGAPPPSASSSSSTTSNEATAMTDNSQGTNERLGFQVPQPPAGSKQKMEEADDMDVSQSQQQPSVSSGVNDLASDDRTLATRIDSQQERLRNVREADHEDALPPSLPAPQPQDSLPSQVSQEFEHVVSDVSAEPMTDATTLGAATDEQVTRQRQALGQSNKILANRVGEEDDDTDMASLGFQKDSGDDVETMETDTTTPRSAMSTNVTVTNMFGGSASATLSIDSNNGDSGDDKKGPTSAEEAERLRRELETTVAEWRNRGDDKDVNQHEAMLLYQQLEHVTHDLSQELCESLRLILEPTLASKLRGDYRTGKRLNMKKIIPYVASQFKKDKIWLRRTRPSKRQYQILIAVDDSHSMADARAARVALETVVLLARALSQLEVGDVGIVGFGERVELVHPFEEPFSAEAGGDIVRRLRFQQHKTFFGKLIETSLDLLRDVRERRGRGRNGVSPWQLEVIVSDGAILDEDRTAVAKLVRRAAEERVLLVCIAVDTRQQSIMDLQNVSYVNGELTITRYMDTFPFEYYIVLRDITTLPAVLSDALRQWFEVLRGLDH